MRALRPILVTALFGLGGMASAAGAQAAVTIGATATPSAAGICATESSIQLRSPGAHYAAPFSGVITAWSYQASIKPPQLKLKVAKFLSDEHTALPGFPYNKATFQIVGESAAETPTSNVLNTFATRIPISAGDLIGLTPLSSGECFIDSRPGYEMAFGGAAPAGSIATFSVRENNERQIDVSARLEADADGDGYGDETQDGCPTSALTQSYCPSSAPPLIATPDLVCKRHKLVGRTLKDAKRALVRQNCLMGKVMRPKRIPKGAKLVVVKTFQYGRRVFLRLGIAKPSKQNNAAKHQHRALGWVVREFIYGEGRSTRAATARSVGEHPLIASSAASGARRFGTVPRGATIERLYQAKN